MKIYLVICGWDYEGADVKACVATEAEAEEIADRIRNDKEKYHYDTVNVQEWTVGEILEGGPTEPKR